MNTRDKRSGLGRRLAEIRHANSWTLSDVSQRTGLAVSTLSKVENGQISLTYDNILKLAEGLDTDVAEFFSSKSGREAGGRRVLTRLSDEKRLETENYVYRYHATELRNASMIPFVVELKAGSTEEFGDLAAHSGEEFIYVLEGDVDVLTEFYEPVRLATGESIYLDSTMGHGFVRPGGGSARILCVCSSSSTRWRAREESRRGKA